MYKIDVKKMDDSERKVLLENLRDPSWYDTPYIIGLITIVSIIAAWILLLFGLSLVAGVFGFISFLGFIRLVLAGLFKVLFLKQLWRGDETFRS